MANIATMTYSLLETPDKSKRDLYRMADLVKRSGFDYIAPDIFNHILDLSCNDTTERGRISELCRVRAYFEELGLRIGQVHAPFILGDRKTNVKNLDLMTLDFVDRCEAVGSNMLVIHSDVYTCERGGYKSEDALAYAYEFLSPIVEKCKSKNIKLAIENMFEEGQWATCRFAVAREQRRSCGLQTVFRTETSAFAGISVTRRRNTAKKTRKS